MPSKVLNGIFAWFQYFYSNQNKLTKSDNYFSLLKHFGLLKKMCSEFQKTFGWIINYLYAINLVIQNNM